MYMSGSTLVTHTVIAQTYHLHNTIIQNILIHSVRTNILLVLEHCHTLII